MDERTKYIILYDYYENLLNDNQKDIFKDYYFDNLSLNEIAENNGVSKNAIFKQLKSIEEKLIDYEEKLQFDKKFSILEKLINKISDEELKEELLKFMKEEL